MFTNCIHAELCDVVHQHDCFVVGYGDGTRLFVDATIPGTTQADKPYE